MSSYSLFFRDCVVDSEYTCDLENDYHAFRLAEGYVAMGGMQLGDTWCGHGLIERAWVHLDGDLTLENSHLELRSAAMFPDDLQNPQTTIHLNSNLLAITGNEPNAEPTVIYSNIAGPGDIYVASNQALHIRGNATVDLTSDGKRGSGCCKLPDDVGTIVADGEFACLDDCTIADSVLIIQDNDFLNAAEISNCRIILPETCSGYGGYLKVRSDALIRCNRIESEGDRYLSFDPDPQAPVRPDFLDNEIHVRIKESLSSGRAVPLELRNEDVDASPGDSASGAYELPTGIGVAGKGYDDPWALEALEIETDAAAVLTNRVGFEFNPENSLYPDTLYAKRLILHPGAVLNTGLQRMYYQTLVGLDAGGSEITLTRDPNNPSAPMENGSRIVDSPLLGFSVAVIRLDDDPKTEENEAETEYEARIGRRIQDGGEGSGDKEEDGTCVGGAVSLLSEETVGKLIQDWDGGGVLEIRTAAQDCEPAESVAAKRRIRPSGFRDSDG